MKVITSINTILTVHDIPNRRSQGESRAAVGESRAAVRGNRAQQSGGLVIKSGVCLASVCVLCVCVRARGNHREMWRILRGCFFKTHYLPIRKRGRLW